MVHVEAERDLLLMEFDTGSREVAGKRKADEKTLTHFAKGEDRDSHFPTTKQNQTEDG